MGPAHRGRQERLRPLFGVELPPHTPDLATYETVELRSGSALAVTTDGVGDALESGPTAREWFADRWAGPPEVGRFLMDVGFEQVQMQDDRTAVVVWCADEETA